MIAQVTPQTRGEFAARLAADPRMGLRIHTLFECYGDFANVCTFYTAGQDGALALMGTQALFAGSARGIDDEEMASFLDFCGATVFESTAYAPVNMPAQKYAALEIKIVKSTPAECGGSGAFNAILSTANSPPSEILNTVQVVHDPPARKIHQLLTRAGVFDGAGEDGFYADVNTRRNRGLCTVSALEIGGELVATAGAYAQGLGWAYISCVGVEKSCRHQGLGTAALGALLQKLPAHSAWLACEESLVPFYEKAGFVRGGVFLHCERE